MPPKFSPDDPAIAALISSFKAIGLTDSKAIEAARSPKNAAALKSLVDRADLTNEENLDEKKATLIASLSNAATKLDDPARLYVVRAVIDGKIKSGEQVLAAVKFLETRGGSIDSNAFDAACGVGVELTPDDIYSILKSLVTSQRIEGWGSLQSVLSAAKNATKLRWAPPLEVKNAGDRVFTELFGPKEVIDKSKPKESKKAASSSSKIEMQVESVPDAPERTMFEEGFLGKLHKPGDNPQIKPELREAHLAATGGKVFTRFPPEPNGYLHIGHSKAIYIDFGYAAHHKGHCYLRYDDTNPEAEEGRYFESILQSVRWLGFEPWKITYSSDYFDQLHAFAVELIKRNKAYVCHCTGEEINANRGGDNHGARKACAHRSRPISESLKGFDGMRDGKYKSGEAILRMKQDLENGNPQMWDLIAYRVLNASHHRTGTKWRIYPTYDFTHCLVDSMESISHSLCTTEFVQARESYEWLCDALEVYKPRQSEFGRLNLQGTITSKRKIQRLVRDGHVLDWDDPRLYTLVALRRRGVPPAAILSFVAHLGVSTALTSIQTVRLDQTIRSYLENTAPRLLMVLKPLKVILVNVPEDYVQMVDKQLHPKVPELGKTTIPFSRELFIDIDDFRLQDSKDYFRLAPGKTVGLFQAPHPITCTSYKVDPTTNEVVELICSLEDGSAGPIPPKPKAFIQWVANHPPSGSPVVVDETRIFNQLFKSDNPAASDDFIKDINPNSLEVVKGALVEIGLWPLAKKLFTEARQEAELRTNKALKEGEVVSQSGSTNDPHGDTPVPTIDQLVGNECVRFQGLRVAYFALDKESIVGCLDEKDDASAGARTGDRIILNRIVSLKEDAGKKAV
ncbi:glutamine-tRNA ligase [Cantharellus anzutake]|uniref:glutamine-tRNA ligase n=1 Tax=Cantharellus anzutake TaxID=1750568 RepID=UPI0019046C5B|nr:glutamine-tRNA ligase [Cantharellus anzutake]KAF8341519.1 glutamine-tRNA ligase [Cantharellus anzutake]